MIDTSNMNNQYKNKFQDYNVLDRVLVNQEIPEYRDRLHYPQYQLDPTNQEELDMIDFIEEAIPDPNQP